MKEFEDLKTFIESLEADVNKFTEKGNSTAGTRVSVGMREVILKAKAIRSAISSMKKQGKA